MFPNTSQNDRTYLPLTVSPDIAPDKWIGPVLFYQTAEGDKKRILYVNPSELTSIISTKIVKYEEKR